MSERWSRVRWIAAGLAGGLLLGGAGVASVWAVGDERGGFMGHRHFHRRHSGPIDPAHAKEHVETGLRWVMRFVDATPEQQDRVRTIATAAVDDLLPMRDQHRANREAFKAALAGASVDRQALEQARKAELKLADEASARLAQAVADAAEVLTPEQRAELAAAVQRFHH